MNEPIITMRSLRDALRRARTLEQLKALWPRCRPEPVQESYRWTGVKYNVNAGRWARKLHARERELKRS